MRKMVRMVVAEVKPSGQEQKREAVALAGLTPLQGAPWGAAACWRALHVRAATADEARPHASEEIYFWRFVAGKHVVEICEQADNCFYRRFRPQRDGISSGPSRNGGETASHPRARRRRQAIVGLHGAPWASRSRNLRHFFRGPAHPVQPLPHGHGTSGEEEGQCTDALAEPAATPRQGEVNGYPPREPRRGRGEVPVREPLQEVEEENRGYPR